MEYIDMFEFIGFEFNRFFGFEDDDFIEIFGIE